MWEPPFRREDYPGMSRNEGFALILENLAHQVRECYLYPEKTIEKAFESFDGAFTGITGVVDFTIKFRLHENREPDGSFLPLSIEEMG